LKVAISEELADAEAGFLQANEGLGEVIANGGNRAALLFDGIGEASAGEVDFVPDGGEFERVHGGQILESEAMASKASVK